MAYNRYAGIVSLPGSDGKMPRPFRVDEDGNVIYLDKSEDVSDRFDDEGPIRLAESAKLDWNGYEALRAQGRRDVQALKDFASHYTKSDAQGAVVGGASRTAGVLGKTAKVRGQYVAEVSRLHPFDNDGREALKEYWRGPMPPETRSILKKARPGLGPRQGSEGRANVTNPKVNEAVRVTRRISRAAGLPALVLLLLLPLSASLEL